MTDQIRTIPPGKLDWRPATDVPDLLASPVAETLQALEIEALVAPIDERLADTVAFCEAYDVRLSESANCVIVEGRRGERTTLAAVMVLATERADVNKTIKKHLDVRKISFASMETATALSGMEYGGITPVGLPDAWPILVDENVAAGGWLVVGSGIRGSKLAVRGASLASLPAAEVMRLTIPPALPRRDRARPQYSTLLGDASHTLNGESDSSCLCCSTRGLSQLVASAGMSS